MLSENAVNGAHKTPQPRAAESDYPQSSMRVTKRSGDREPVDVNKIVRAVSRCCVGFPDVDHCASRPRPSAACTNLVQRGHTS